VRLIDDSYNASPAAVQAMLASLAATPTRGRRVAVLGEMRELGSASATLHEDSGRAAARVADVLVAIGGPAAEGLAVGARVAGLPAANVHRFADSASAAAAIATIVAPGDLVLVKGSRGTRTDLVVDRLVEGG
jgi:UDP-N-acetylmuramoyl-tripeptide--D-alanyl-D-alanine ligase